MSELEDYLLEDFLSLESLLQKANANDAFAQAKLGYLHYARNDAVKQDFAEARKWFEMADLGGNMFARTMLGMMYMQGLGVEKNDSKAVEFFAAPAESGITMAQLFLGDLLRKEELAGGNDPVKAKEWLSKVEASGIKEHKDFTVLAMEHDARLKHCASSRKVLWSASRAYYNDNQDIVLKTSPRIVLYGKEGICVYAQTTQLERIGNVPWVDPEFETKLSQLLPNNVTDPILFLCNDTGLVNEKIVVPEVYLGSSLLAAFLRRNSKNELPEGHYISAIKSNGEHLPHTYNVASFKTSPELLCKVSGAIGATAKSLAMLPIETTDLTIELASKLSTSNDKLKRWCALVGQTETGGLRQIITDGSNIIFSRLVPLPALTSAGERVQWIEKDFFVVAHTLIHFGYKPETGMDVVFICDEEEMKLYSPSAQLAITKHLVTLHDAMEKLGINGCHLPASRFADPLYAGWILKRATLKLPFLGPDFKQVNLMFFQGSQTNLSSQDVRSLYMEDKLLLDAGRFTEAQAAAKTTLELCKKICGPESIEVAACLNRQGEIYIGLNKYKEAMTCFRNALTLIEEQLGSDHPGIVTYLNNVALMQKQGKENEAAEVSYRRAVSLCEKYTEMVDQSAMSIALQGLAEVYVNQSNWIGAEALYLRSLAIGEKIYQPDHHLRLGPMLMLALIYDKRIPDYAKAASCYEFVIAAGEKAVTAGVDFSATLDRLGKIYMETDHFDKAILVFQRAKEIHAKKGVEATIPSLDKIAEAYSCLGDYAKAQDIRRQAIAIYEEEFGPVGPEPLVLGSIMSSLAAGYTLTNNYDIAEQLFLRVLSLYDNAPPSWGPKVSFVLEQLTRFDIERRDFVQAEKRALRAMELREKAFGATHERMAVLLAVMATIYRETGREYQHLFDRAEYIRKLHKPHQA